MVIKDTKKIQFIFFFYRFDFLFYLLYLRATIIPYHIKTGALEKVPLVLDDICNTEVLIHVVILYLDLNGITLQLHISDIDTLSLSLTILHIFLTQEYLLPIFSDTFDTSVILSIVAPSIS